MNKTTRPEEPAIENIIRIFNAWYKEELNSTTVRIPTACCLSTIGLDGFPNARFVSLKDVIQNRFIVTGTLESRKGNEIGNSGKVALTFWWTKTERQVRIQGNAIKMPTQLADRYFAERNRDSQIVSIVSAQGREISDPVSLTEKYETTEKQFLNKTLKRPDNWGGYEIDPVRIEFMEFKPTRFHERTLYELINGQWTAKQIQP